MNKLKNKPLSGIESLGRIGRCRRTTAVIAVTAACLVAPGATLADRSGSSRLDIDRARWDREDQRIEVRGDKDRDPSLTLVNAHDPAQVLASGIDQGDDNWRVRSRSPEPVPCRVRAIQSDGETVERDVYRAPSDCAPKTPPVSLPPTANANGPYSGTVGARVAFSSSGSAAPAGRARFLWDFGDGASSAEANPTYTYDAAGSFTVTLTITDAEGASTTDTTAALIADAGNGGDGGTGGGGGNGGGITPPDVSINSTSRSCGDAADPNDPNPPACADTPVPEQPFTSPGGYSILAINDLGMHCGDLDTRISSILPPFQVLLAQVIRKGAEPEMLGPDEVDVFYSAVSNPNDPILGDASAFRGLTADGSVYKTNFWDYPLLFGSYDAFYPAFSPFDNGFALTPLSDVFGTSYDVGLPVPNVEALYLGPDGQYKSGDEFLAAAIEDMPGIAAPYATASPLSNEPQEVHEYLRDKPFFGDFPFGYIAEGLDWFEGAGIPFAAYDDFGRENAYPLVRVQATVDGNAPGDDAGNVVATVDTVLPISGEASCKNCHADPMDENFGGSRTSYATDKLLDADLPVASSNEDPLFQASKVPADVAVEWATDINVLRLHDLKHGADYVSYCDAAPCPPEPCDISANGGDGDASCLTNQALVQQKPVVCQTCHYTPALDLAQLGPLAGPPGTTANGRNQLAHPSNSRVMHSHHGALTDENGDPLLDNNGDPLFPAIEPPRQAANGAIENQAERIAQLEDSCYQCHPGTSVQCLRGAMFNGGMLCSDCHGGMEAVGADFTAGVSPDNPGAFQLGLGNFYDYTSAQPRVPWANEPGCGSCHTGDATDNVLTNPADGLDEDNVLVNVADMSGNADGIRLRQAFRVGDPKATPIVPANTRFAENSIPQAFNGFENPGHGVIPESGGAQNPQLYRVSTGHEGVMCEGCHGATHAEWPNGNPNANDNVTASQLQGHTGTIIECSTCHGDGWEPGRGDELDGPHGMHVVGDTDFADGGHENVAEGNEQACFACHGGTGRDNSPGTVLSRAATDRTLSNEGRTVQVAKGEPVGCVLCHDGSGD